MQYWDSLGCLVWGTAIAKTSFLVLILDFMQTLFLSYYLASGIGLLEYYDFLYKGPGLNPAVFLSRPMVLL